MSRCLQAGDEFFDIKKNEMIHGLRHQPTHVQGKKPKNKNYNFFFVCVNQIFLFLFHSSIIETMELNLKRCEKKNQITQCFFGCLKFFFLIIKKKKSLFFCFVQEFSISMV